MRRLVVAAAALAVLACYDFSGYHLADRGDDGGVAQFDAGSGANPADGGEGDAGSGANPADGGDEDAGTSEPAAHWTLHIDEASSLDTVPRGLVADDTGIRAAYRDHADGLVYVERCTVTDCSRTALSFSPAVDLLSPVLALDSGGLYRVAGGISQEGAWEGTSSLAGDAPVATGASVLPESDNVAFVQVAIDVGGRRAFACTDASSTGVHRVLLATAGRGGAYGTPAEADLTATDLALAISPTGNAYVALVAAHSALASHTANAFALDTLSTSAADVGIAANETTTYVAWFDTSTMTIHLATLAFGSTSWSSEDTGIDGGSGVAVDVDGDGNVLLVSTVGGVGNPLVALGQPGGPWSQVSMPPELAQSISFRNPTARLVDGVVQATYYADGKFGYVRYGP